MFEKLKDGRFRHYCDYCGELIYELVPKNCGCQLFTYKRIVKKKYVHFFNEEYCVNCYIKSIDLIDK